MSALFQVNLKVFPSGKNRIVGRDIRVKTTTGAPSDAAPLGTIVWNSFDKEAYICSVISGTYIKLTV